ncbi:hypothetical protein BCR32DRAFT_240941 [Anaeromyces robustus]|uniref:FTP domain-containing protein n=1 Tax=Anaeromyces robustus TaxID=1754192 RepID=A0A1Y1XMH8_9FUNG|nr:hypothetical protein BCR32DRAFT_240941 [Anaeromyces robustus]|eukprot:ORX86544.1 hypothetical protein BCR32DRAFT_240941 [Anaeromyces robustus]
MKIFNYGIILLWIFSLFLQLVTAEEKGKEKEKNELFTPEQFIELAKNYIYENYGILSCNYRAVIDNVAYVYIDQTANDIPIRSLDSLIMFDKTTAEIIYTNMKIKTTVYERYVENTEPLPLENVPEFINDLSYHGEYKINIKDVEVIPTKKFRNNYYIDNIPFLLDEESDNENFIEIEKVYEPITSNTNINNNKDNDGEDTSNIVELAYYIKYIDVNYDTYSIILFAYSHEVKKITKDGF